MVRELAARPAAQINDYIPIDREEVTQPTNLLFNPVVPCRIVDTRNWEKLEAGVPRPIYAANQGYGAQGGHEADCGIPYGGTKAVMVNVTTTQWDGRGSINAWPYDPSKTEQPLASIANFGPVTGMSAIANAMSLAICDTRQSVDDCAGGDLFFQANGSGTHLVIDVVGYYTEAASIFGPARAEQ